MKHKVMFGPAGSPVNYKGAAYKAPKYIKEEGLDSYEYQSPYGVRIGEKSAKILKEESEKHDILISMHGPYYINLCSKEEEKIKKSLNHLIATARAGEWMGAYRLVFHPGFYSNRKPGKAMEISKNTINQLFEELELKVLKNLPLRQKLQVNVHSREMFQKLSNYVQVLIILNQQLISPMFMHEAEGF